MTRKAFSLFLASLLCLLAGDAARAHVQDPQDEILKAVGLDERLGAALPLDAPFLDDAGKAVRLRDFFTGGPVILTLNYYTCPMLCPLTLRNLLAAAQGIRGISLERDFRIVTVSIDPAETQEAARARAAEMRPMMAGIRDPGARWAFLRGDAASVAALTRAVGFRYVKVGAEFAHPDASVVLTPDGRVSRYVYGVDPSAAFLKMALLEASGGRIGESEAMNRVILYCFHYDPVGKKYAIYARNIMKAGGILTLVLLGALYLGLWGRRRGAGTAGPGGDGR